METMRDGVSASGRHRPAAATTAPAHGTALRRAAAAVLLALWALFAASAAPASADDQLVKVFVVQDAATTGGAPATLASVAASTLGDPARAAEIFDLNRGQAQTDGSALTGPDEQLHPGWILRLPQDASGPDVQLARDTAAQNDSAPPAATDSGAGTGTDTGTGTGGGAAFTIPLPAAIAVLGAVLLALVTAGIVGRRRVGAAWAAAGRAVRRLGDPVARRRRLALRRTVGRHFAADAGSVRRAYAAAADLSGPGDTPGRPVHALRVDSAGVTAWLAPGDTPGAPWTALDGPEGTRWRRTTDPGASRVPDDRACLVRVGVDADGEPVFYDLSRLDGVLSVTGDRAVARDVVHGLLEEVARSRPGTPVTVLRGSEDATPLTLPSGLRQVVRIGAEEHAPAFPGQSAPEARGTVRGAAARRPVTGLVVMAGTPTGPEAADLAALCGPGGAGWTGLVCGEVGGAHWRWQAGADGAVDIPVLGVRLTVPA
ncbi:hypothetical protein ACFYXS_18040 [Streptomyces sp. NPDC002574]|uniref:hypothetical protein n=1 Tax=Streptomyces sp. NPDC002574 TaxID=3364652 RepID=UPI003697711A